MQVIFFVAILASLKLSAQGYYSLWYNTDNLLLQNSIKDITKDRYGFIWIATEREVLQYDGFRFTRQDLALNSLHLKTFRGNTDTDSIAVSNEAEQQMVLIRNRKSSIVNKSGRNADMMMIRNKPFKIYFKRDLGAEVTDEDYVVVLKHGWYAFSTNKITYTDRHTGNEIQIPMKFNCRDIKNIFVYRDTLFYADSSKRKVVRMHHGSVTALEADSLYTDPQSKIYWEQINNQTFIIHDNIIYLSTYKNNVLSLKKIIRYPDLEYSHFYSMYYDESFNLLYLGSLTKGLNIVRPGTFMISRQHVPFANNVYNALLPVSRDKIITPKGIVLDSSGLNRKYPFNQDNNSYTLCHDDNGNILCTRGGKIERYNAHSGFQKSETVTMPFDVNRLFKIGSKIFVSGLSNGISSLSVHPGTSFSKPVKVHQFGSPVVSVVQYNEDTVLVACSKELYQMDISTQKLRKIKIPPVITLKKISAGKDGRFWIISENRGFYLLKNNVLIPMPADYSGYLFSSHDVLEDNRGFLWIPTNNGLFKADVKEVLRAAKKNGILSLYYRYSTKDGLANNEFNGGASVVGSVLENGMFVLPSMDGIAFFNPLNVKSYYPDKNMLFIDKVKINGSKILNFNDRVTLPNGFEKAEFYIDIPYYASNENLVLEVKGSFEDSWHRVAENRMYILNELDPGDYELTVRMLLDEKGTYAVKTLQVSVPPMYYQTWWFKVFIVSSATFLLALLIHNRTRKLKSIVRSQTQKIESVEKNLELTETKLQTESKYQEQLFQTITHDIATPIKHLSNLSQMMHQTDNIELQKKYLENVYQSSEQLYILTMSLREYREIFSTEHLIQDPYLISEVVSYKVGLFKDIAAHEHTVIVTDISEDIWLRVSKVALSVIIHNILDNAVKNTAGGTIKITVSKDHNATTISISDTGKGMGEKRLAYYNNLYSKCEEGGLPGYTGLGLYMIIRLCRKFGIRLRFSDHIPSGTVILLQIDHE